MTVAENDFPLLEHILRPLTLVRNKIPIRTDSPIAKEHLKNNSDLTVLLNSITTNHEISYAKPIHTMLAKPLSDRMDNDQQFRRTHFNMFTRAAIQQVGGTILLPDKHLFAFEYWDRDYTELMMKCKGRYMGVASFKGDRFLGFEEGVLIGKEFSIKDTGYYGDDNSIDKGKFLQYCSIFLSYLKSNGKVQRIAPSKNKSTAEISYLK